MNKKHFLCTHTWVSPEARDTVMEKSREMTDRDFFNALKTERAETLQHWMGKEDFFYCHWLAEDEDAIFESLEAAGFNDFMASLPTEMTRYITSSDISDQPLGDPYEENKIPT